jgi:hypothetical protein
VKLDYQGLNLRLPMGKTIQKGWARWLSLLPKLPELSWSFFVLEEGHWAVLEPHLEPAFTQIEDVKQLDKTGIWIRVLPWKNIFHQDLKLNFFDPAKRRKLIPFQIEPLLPFLLEESTLSHCFIEKEAVGWVCAIPNKELVHLEEESLRQGLGLDGFVSPLFALFKGHQHYFKTIDFPVLYTQKESDRLVFVLVDHQKIWGLRLVILKDQTIDPTLLELEARRTKVALMAPEQTRSLWIGPREGLTLEGYDTLEVDPKVRESFLLLGAKALVETSDRYDALLHSRQSHLASKIFPWVKGWTWASTALLTALLIYTGIDQFSQNRQQKELAQQIIQEATQQNITLPELEAFSSLEAWTLETENFIQSKLSPYPLQADLPSPRDTLGWLSDILVNSGNAHIVSFEYKSESFPDSKHALARYRVKVELEFEAFDPAVAEAIQQKLLKAYEWIEKPSALVWKAQKDRYQVSFYLRDKTRYVQ